MRKSLIVTILFISTAVGRASADGNASPAVKSVTIKGNISGAPVTCVDSTRANFDSGTYTSGTQWWGDEVKLRDLMGAGPVEVDTAEVGLVGLWHMNGNWLDARGTNNVWRNSDGGV